MPRLARVVIPKLPHHVTQRGNRKNQVFFTDLDRRIYLEWLGEYCIKHGVEVLSYCLMTNHVHLVLVPLRATSLESVLKPLHMRYSQRINRLNEWKGHLWQGRFYSSPFDQSSLCRVVAYVERNPVRANLVTNCYDYKWSSAAAHCKLREDSLLSRDPQWNACLDTVGSWKDWISIDYESKELTKMRNSFSRGLPYGTDNFIDQLEEISGRDLKFRNPGRQPK